MVSSRPRAVTVRAPAKVNLELRVGPRRADGYHTLATVYMGVGLWDEVTLRAADEWSVQVDGLQHDLVPADADNLAVRAAMLVAERVGIGEALAIHIHKEIPVAGGMAGGSADAAAALVAANAYWDGGLGRDELLELAASIGSDVPFSLTGGIAIGSGRGELVTPVLAKGSYHWVFALSAKGLSTTKVYAECDRLRALAGTRVGPPRPGSALMTALRSGDPVALGRALVNDLEPAALSLRPDLGEVLDVGREFGALGAVVSGSGPTVALLGADVEASIDISVALTASGVAAEVRRAIGPVHGAHVIPTAAGT